MSEKDRFDWNDETDFESLADEPIEGFADFDDMGDYAAETDAEVGEVEAVADEDLDESPAEATASAVRKPAPVGPYVGRGISGVELGFVFAASVLVAAAGVGSAALLAFGVNPVELWQPQKLLVWQDYLQPQANPLHMLALVLVGVVCLTLLGSRAVSRAAGRANKRAEAAEEMLDRVTSLRLENEKSWQDPVFKPFAPAATFVSETLGAWRLQAARQKHFTGLEGELHRLEKALANNSRSDLTGRFDSPAVGTLSDEMVRYFDEREALTAQIEKLRNKDQAEAAEIVQILQDARCWQHVAQENLGLQGSSVDRLATRIEEFGREQADVVAEADVVQSYSAFKTAFETARRDAGRAPDGMQELNDLVDKGSKLAFQIAMEVARLGPRGERLAPMSRSLEDLTTEFRTVSGSLSGAGDQDANGGANLDELAVKLAAFEKDLRANTEAVKPEKLAGFGSAAGQLARNLAELVQSFGPQAQRLTNLGNDLRSFTGAAFDAEDLTSGNPENPPAGVLVIEGRTPFVDDDGVRNDDGIHQPADVDPFAVTPPLRANDAPGDPSFTGSVGEPDADIFGAGLDHDELPSLEIESSFGERHEPFSADQPTAEPALSEPAEKVYDLEDFGAAAVVDDEPAEQVYDLADFGAEPVAADAPEPAAEPVADLADFGAVPLTDEEPVLDLMDLGAVRLDGAGSGGDEVIHDLNEFGAVPLN